MQALTVDQALRSADGVSLHCPPTRVYYQPEVFGVLDDLVQARKLRYYGVSVEKVEEALKAIEYPGVQSMQIIFNMFRQRPAGKSLTQVALRWLLMFPAVTCAIHP